MLTTKPRSGFSIFEISITLLLIALIAAGALSASRVVSYMILNTAREDTEESAIKYMRRDVIVWFDSTSEKSFIDSEVKNGSRISTWYETKPISTIPAAAIQNDPDKQPTYAATAINGLPALKFDGIDDSMSITAASYVTSDAPLFYNNFSVFLVAQAKDNIVAEAESNKGISGQKNQRYALFPPSGDNIYPNIRDSASAGISFGLNGISFYENSEGYTPPIMSSSAGYSRASAILMEYKNKTPKLYVNGKQTKVGLTSIKNRVFPPFYIGGGPSPWESYGNFSGHIAEIIIINRSLTKEEIDDVFSYLKKKWKLNY
ncbi:MAG: hypothetical protein KGP29_00645 [Proteobacteria bacterium]|nr:hypothetical protein [Pseudomonadota bacterium]